MNELKEIPKDLMGYVKASHLGSLDADESNLRGLVKQGISNILAEGFPFVTITNIEEDAKTSGYAIFFVQLEGSPALADFLFKKF